MKQKYYDFDKAKKLAEQNKGFVFGERGAGREHFEEQFEQNVEGLGKSQEEKLALADTGLSVLTKDEETIVVDPEGASKDESYVVVVNKNGLVPVRHIVAVEKGL